MKNITLTIDGQKVTVPENFTVIKAAERLGIDIPALCYDPNLEIASACRLCLVEVEGSKKLQTSCSLKVKEGMVVYTESERVVNIRKEILQLILDNHPNDCLTCQKAGECLLQKYAYRYDVKFREHGGEKRLGLRDTSSPYILKDDSKCILCGKCVRTCNQIHDRAVLSFAQRGFETKIVADGDFSLEKSSCVSCNRCVTVCPVGALVDKRLIGKSRIWDGEVKTVKCKVCDYGCNFEVLYKNGKSVAVRAKSPSNGRPLCLKGRLTTELLYLDNPETPYKKEDGEFVEATWKEVLGLEDIFEKIIKIDDEK
ncbi:4Fe-4S dicluster domain-containing protein [Anaerosalibacter bizertensis]|uniref:2Fe-2S iron-sulfur cluster-binding protein n=1 Tax=Anaerosalibacter bizertensis TaxID=932217 RepID=A0A844FFK9_9FIRM|nr:2Fe-2S iron-sulfur cluster-binding protein [Anaerosalibacter bizertensis]MBV1817767.1 (2Fe-2S)-binding protein [Bacteroidales bacterium MSK.15.36]HHV27040.1 4Fe-4S dicluster domain-containing protein [Tissierellia bacterium]MCB5559028.1 (2Fe-2S)-binding protein [Anaerosalibacter bizertensis]MCG4564312.1 2Fe-2S iron-sulfur cluster-binding protein [Anaerosalibacter bizertensis]MCG4581493.1 2Fe-2S iron-sulfur cluster-binding protein [Anaerosalibacter bizertensis]